MKPVFWKLSHGKEFFSYEEFMQTLMDELVYVHADTQAKGRLETTQGEDFVDAKIGDYFYLTWGNGGVYLFGQLTGPANRFSQKKSGWLDRPYRLIKLAKNMDSYNGPDKWWAPNHRSTFVRVPDEEVPEFEQHILEPFFGIKLKAYK